MAVCLPDTQDDTPSVPIKLTRVGVTGVKKLLQLERPNKRPIILLPTFDAFVDLPFNQKGVHMSRNPEAISEVLDSVSKDNNIGVESLWNKNLVKIIKSVCIKLYKFNASSHILGPRFCTNNTNLKLKLVFYAHFFNGFTKIHCVRRSAAKSC